ncbi:MAG: MATE family efflux transporter [Clostridia bacterium]|nr:MATE family efflux transporter [Clostridia bacterium]
MNELHSQKMATMPVKKLLISMSLPAIFSMLVQAIYNIVDSLYLGHFSKEALTAVSIVFPLQMLVGAIGIGIGVGANVFISKSLGEGKREQASRAAQNGLFIVGIAIILAIVLGFTVVKPFVYAYTDDPVTREMAVEYLSTCMIFSFGMLLELTTSKILQSTGNMRVPMFTQLIGAVTNIILDPFFIFGIGFFPRLGAKGAAIATVIGQMCAMTFSISMLIFRKQDVNILEKGFHPSLKLMGSILRVGLPSMLITALPSFTTIIVNVILKQFGENAITVLGVYFKLQSFVFMPVFGLTQGGMPILSYNYGAYYRDRFSQTFRFMLTLALSAMLFGLILFQSIPQYLMRMFNDDPTLVAMGPRAMRIISLAFIFAAGGISITTMMQSIGRGFTSLLITISRQIIIIPAAYVLAIFSTAETIWVWFAYPIAEVVTLSVFAPISMKVFKKEFNKRREVVRAMNALREITPLAPESPKEDPAAE